MGLETWGPRKAVVFRWTFRQEARKSSLENHLTVQWMLKSHKSTIAFLCDYSSEDDQNNIEKTAKDLATFKTYTDNLQFKGHKKCHYI